MLEEPRVLIAGPDDAALILAAPEGVFDDPVRQDLVHGFLREPGHHICVAADGGRAVGFVSALDHLHPDKPRQLWIHELSVHAKWRCRGLGGRLLTAMLDHGRQLGCRGAWVIADRDADAARRLYARIGGQRSDEHEDMYTFAL